MTTTTDRPLPARPQKGAPMEGVIATWYARSRRDPEAAVDVERIAALAAPGAPILEIATGPGHVALDLAARGFDVTALDSSASFLRIGYERARASHRRVTWVLSDAADLPFEDGRFAVTVCRAAFKNFTAPVQAIEEMYRVLQPGGTALILDLWGGASPADIRGYVEQLGLRPVDRWLTEKSLSTFLLRNAYTIPAMEELVARTSFKTADIKVVNGTLLDVALTR